MSKSSGKDGLKEALVIHLSGGGKLSLFAETHQLNIRTAQRLAADPSVRPLVRALRQDNTDRAVGLLCVASVSAVGQLITLMQSGNESSRLQAARAILTMSMALAEFSDLSERLQAVEAGVAKLSAERPDDGEQAYPYRLGKQRFDP